ncbi:MAG: NUDIX domain-containing protein, partial [Nitrosomonadaceae bacterium]|nr:NUDIX domain-containing protein [Nitrosomonadaceae bacterium]
MSADVEILEKTICFEGFFRIEKYRLRHRLFNGGWSRPLSRELFERGHAAAVLPYDPIRDAVILIEQFRVGALTAPGGPWLLEIVAGMIESGETAQDVVKRESIEEADCIITDLLPVCDFLVSPGGTSERIALFCGRADAA